MADLFSPLWYWMNERQNIRIKRYRGDPYPWTKDPILSGYRFCEVFREDDKVTKWIVDNWLKPNLNHRNLWIACCVARQINWPDTLKEIGFPDYAPGKYKEWGDHAIDVMDTRMKNGKKVYTGAYVIYGGPGKSKGFPNKSSWTINGVIYPLERSREGFDEYFQDIPENERSFRAVCQSITGYPGWSGFMADQAVCDMSYTPLLNKAVDLSSWCNPGPGCVRGLNRLFNRDLKSKLTVSQAVSEMQMLLKIANSSMSPLEDHIPKPILIHTIESGLCETDKYLRLMSGGRVRSTYSPFQ